MTEVGERNHKFCMYCGAEIVKWTYGNDEACGACKDDTDRFPRLAKARAVVKAINAMNIQHVTARIHQNLDGTVPNVYLESTIQIWWRDLLEIIAVANRIHPINLIGNICWWSGSHERVGITIQLHLSPIGKERK